MRSTFWHIMRERIKDHLGGGGGVSFSDYYIDPWKIYNLGSQRCGAGSARIRSFWAQSIILNKFFDPDLTRFTDNGLLGCVNH